MGRKWSLVNGEEIKMNFNNFLHDKGLSEEELVSKGQKYLSIIQELAPHWRRELDAVAETLNLDPEALTVYMGEKYRDVNLKDCFSYMVTPNLTEGGKTLYHKNRDNRYRHQSAYIKHVKVKGKRIYKYIAIGNVSDVGLMMMVNEQGLAGAADTEPPDPKPRWTGLMNPDILRYIAENAATCEEALAIIKRFTEKQIYAGGKLATNYCVYIKEHNEWHKQTIAHNTVLIDNKSQEDITGTLRKWEMRKDFDLVSASHNGYQGITHTRTVFHPRREYFIINDFLKSSDIMRHSYTWLLHVYGKLGEHSKSLITFTKNGKGLLILPVDPGKIDSLSVKQGLCIDSFGARKKPVRDDGRFNASMGRKTNCAHQPERETAVVSPD